MGFWRAWYRALTYKRASEIEVEFKKVMQLHREGQKKLLEMEMKFNRDQEQRRWDEIFKGINLNRIKKTKERIKNPKSIWKR